MHDYFIRSEMTDGVTLTALKLAALADPTRLQIVTHLFAAGPLRVNELAVMLNLKMATMSFHLAQLRAAGLVLDTRSGQAVSYTIHPDAADVPWDFEAIGCLKCGLAFVHIRGPRPDRPPAPELDPPYTPKTKKGSTDNAA